MVVRDESSFYIVVVVQCADTSCALSCVHAADYSVYVCAFGSDAPGVKEVCCVSVSEQQRIHATQFRAINHTISRSSAFENIGSVFSAVF